MPLQPLYPILTVTIAITVATGGALAGATEIPVDALNAGIPSGTILKFGAGKYAELTADALADDEALETAPLGVALIAGDTASYAPASAEPLLGERWSKLGGKDLSSEERTALQRAYHIAAELALNLRAPLYTGDDALEIGFYVVRQIIFMIEHGITPSIVKSVAQGNPSATKTFRDRWLDPDAAAGVARVTGDETVRFAPFAAGV